MTIPEHKQFLERALGRVKRILANTPDDRLLWSPAPSARTPIALVVHIATSIHHIHQAMMGNRYETSTMAEADAEFLAVEQTITTREAALDHLDEKCETLFAWMETLTEDRLTDSVPLPFGMGEAPLELMLMMLTWHTNDHAAQMDYIQTCYGNRTWN